MTKRKSLTRVLTLLLILASILSFGAFTSRAFAAGEESEISYSEATEDRAGEVRSGGVIAPRLSPVSATSVWSYSSYKINLLGKQLSVSARLIGDTVYLPLRAVSEALGLSVKYNSATRTTAVVGRGLSLSATDGSYAVYANERPLFVGKNSRILSDGRMYVPADILMKAYGLTYSRASGGTVRISGTYKPLTHAKDFYRSDEVLWLSRIISAESRGESLLGQIAVGTVVMNRVASKYYPNTIYGVIFDRKYGVQFSPIEDGSIYNTPTYNCILAAKICLEGVRVGDGTLFFLRPELSDSLWIPASRTYLFSIGHHDFYK